jgi:ribonucleoside-diphosphate reductase beta chain
MLVADRLLVPLGYSKIYNAYVPFDLMGMLSVQGKTNFFEKRVGVYQKAGVISIRAANTFLLDEAFLTIGVPGWQVQPERAPKKAR